MNGIRTWMLQDMHRGLPTKACRTTAVSHIHTCPVNRRFWDFLQFLRKKDSSKGFTVPSYASNKIERRKNVSRIEKTSPRSTSMTNAKRIEQLTMTVLHFDSTPITKIALKTPDVFTKSDNVTSLLDGNRVPMNLKLKLTGYKTLRSENAEEFAFVPGGGQPAMLDVLCREQNQEESKIMHQDSENLSPETTRSNDKGEETVNSSLTMNAITISSNQNESKHSHQSQLECENRTNIKSNNDFLSCQEAENMKSIETQLATSNITDTSETFESTKTNKKQETSNNDVKTKEGMLISAICSSNAQKTKLPAGRVPRLQQFTSARFTSSRSPTMLEGLRNSSGCAAKSSRPLTSKCLDLDLYPEEESNVAVSEWSSAPISKELQVTDVKEHAIAEKTEKIDSMVVTGIKDSNKLTDVQTSVTSSNCQDDEKSMDHFIGTHEESKSMEADLSSFDRSSNNHFAKSKNEDLQGPNNSVLLSTASPHTETSLKSYPLTKRSNSLYCPINQVYFRSPEARQSILNLSTSARRSMIPSGKKNLFLQSKHSTESTDSVPKVQSFSSNVSKPTWSSKCSRRKCDRPRKKQQCCDEKEKMIPAKVICTKVRERRCRHEDTCDTKPICNEQKKEFDPCESSRAWCFDLKKTHECNFDVPSCPKRKKRAKKQCSKQRHDCNEKQQSCKNPTTSCRRSRRDRSCSKRRDDSCQNNNDYSYGRGSRHICTMPMRKLSKTNEPEVDLQTTENDCSITKSHNFSSEMKFPSTRLDANSTRSFSSISDRNVSIVEKQSYEGFHCCKVENSVDSTKSKSTKSSEKSKDGDGRKSDDYCKQMKGNKQDNSKEDTESNQDRVDREMKEIRECKQKEKGKLKKTCDSTKPKKKKDGRDSFEAVSVATPVATTAVSTCKEINDVIQRKSRIREDVQRHQPNIASTWITPSIIAWQNVLPNRTFSASSKRREDYEGDYEEIPVLVENELAEKAAEENDQV